MKTNNIEVVYSLNNPLLPETFGNASYGFEGKKLVNYSDNLVNISFQYDENGYIIERTDNDTGIISNYIYDNNKLITEIKDNIRNDYLYDENNKLYGFIQNGVNVYCYVRDSRGNILGIVDNNVIIVVKYNYDVYGNNISYIGTNIYNPFLYKGYYYDYDLKMYYCHTRFYNPLWRRWLTPDNPCYLNQEIISGMNLFVYCNNNPVMNVDEEGMFWITLSIGLSIGTYEILVALGILAAGATVTAVAITESEYHYIENGIKSIGNQESSLDIDDEDFMDIKKDAYERKKAAPRIKKKTKKEAEQAAFLKGGKTKPIFHNGKYGPHFHPNNPKFKHWHYYFPVLYVLLNIGDEEDKYESLSGILYF